MARLRACGIHLAISAGLALILVLLVSRVWYPYPLFELAKGRDIFILLICCDIVIGPTLTLVVFNARKPRSELVRDLAIIGALQLAAMSYGMWTLLQARPAYIVYNGGQFNVPLAGELVDDTPETLSGAMGAGGVDPTAPKSNPGDTKAPGDGHPESQAKPDATPRKAPPAPWFGPELVGTRRITDVHEHNRLLFSAVQGQGDVFQMPKYFVPYGEVKDDVIAHTRTVTELSRYLRYPQSEIEDAVTAYGKPGLNFGLLPVVIRSKVAVAVVDKKTGALLGIEPILHDAVTSVTPARQ